MLTVKDELEIGRLMALYGHVVDDQQLSRVDELFATNAIYDVRNRGLGLFVGGEAIRTFWGNLANPPLAHHFTNVVTDEVEDGIVCVAAKGLIVHANGIVHSTTYHFDVTRTPAGWRISHLATELPVAGSPNT